MPGFRAARKGRRPFPLFPALALCLAAALPALGEKHAASPDTASLPDAEARARKAPLADADVIAPADEDRLLGDLPDLLERVAGVHVVRSGGFGDYVGVFMHGSSDRQVSVYVNGIPQDPTRSPGAGLGDRDLARVERIEVYKGLAPPHLPGSPMGGAINIITRDRVRGGSAEAAAGAGSFGARRATARAGLEREAYGAHVQGSYDRADGDFPYYDDDGTEFLPGRHPDGAPRRGADDLVRKERRNNGHAFAEAAADAAFRPAEAWSLGVQADRSWLRKEVPASFASLDDSVEQSAYRRAERAFLRGWAARSSPGRDLHLDLSAASVTEDYTDTSLAGGAVGLGYDRDRNRYADFSASASERRAAGRLALTSLVSYAASGYRFSDRVLQREYPWLWRYVGEGKVSPSLTLGKHLIQASAAAALHREEHHGDAPFALGGRRLPAGESGALWSLRAGWQYRPLRGFALSAHGGNAYRLPTFLEKFGDRGGVLGNPALRPESGVNLVAGAEVRGEAVVVELRGFAYHGRRIITLMQNSQNVLFHANTGSTRILGAEASARLRPARWSRSEATATLQRALNLSGGPAVDDYKLIPYRPLALGTLRQTFLAGGWVLSAEGRWQGITQPNPSNRPSLFDAYSHNTAWQTRLDLRVSWRGRHLLAAAGMENALDQRNFDFFNFPLPGRSLTASVQAGF